MYDHKCSICNCQATIRRQHWVWNDDGVLVAEWFYLCETCANWYDELWERYDNENKAQPIDISL